MKLKTRDIVYIGFIAALCAVATTIRIEIPGGAMVHLGSAALFTSSILFGGLYGGLGAAIGSALFDLFGGHTQYIVFSFFIKGIAGLIVGGMTAGYLPPSITKPTASFTRILIALIIGTIWTAFGYFLAWWFVLESAAVAASKIQYSLIQDIADIFAIHGINTEIIAASVRTPLHILQCAKAGAHIATVPYKVLLQAMKHPLTDAGLEKFMADWKQANQ